MKVPKLVIATSDEELVLSSGALADALRTRIGGRGSKTNAGEGDTEDGGMGHHANCQVAVQACQEIWGPPETLQAFTMPRFHEPESLNNVLTSARA